MTCFSNFDGGMNRKVPLDFKGWIKMFGEERLVVSHFVQLVFGDETHELVEGPAGR